MALGADGMHAEAKIGEMRLFGGDDVVNIAIVLRARDGSGG